MKRRFSVFRDVSPLMILLFVTATMADGYRPDSDLAAGFIADVTTARIIVFPTVIRDPIISRFSTASRDHIVEYLKSNRLGIVSVADTRFYIGEPQGRSQFEMFQSSMRTIGGKLGSGSLDADYVMILEILFPPSRDKVTEVFGIHVYILTPEGGNAFSFLLNAHHQSFVDAKLRTSDMTAEGKEKLALDGTKVAMQALKKQVTEAQACALRESDTVPQAVGADVIDNFEAGLLGGEDRHGLPLGFSTFNGKKSSAAVSTTMEYPRLPAAAPDNSVLKLEFDVESWAGVMHRFENDLADQWISYDWSDSEELSFWLYGQDTGTTLVIDVLDNRNRCSMSDDAERFTYQFSDTFSGWKLFAIPFEVMIRKEIGNGAPDDGLGLSSVHGWGFAALRTDGEITYFIDDVRLRRTPLMERVPDGLSRDDDIWSPTNELPMYGEYEKTSWQKKVDERFFAMVLPDFEGDREAAAEHFARVGWNLYYEGDKPTAIKRFNQAWMLDENNQNALWGFAVISRERGKIASAVRFYKLALDTGRADPKLQEEYAQVSRAIVD